MKILLKEKIIRIWQFIKAQKESYITTYLANQIKQKNTKITVVFIVYFPEAFASFQALYKMLKSDNRFNVYILCQPFLENPSINNSYLFLSERYSDVINAYENSKWYNLEKLTPDYVFYCRPYNPDYYEKYNSSTVRKYANVCFITYAYNLENKKDYNFNFVNNYDFLQNCSYIFTSTDYEKKILKKRFLLSMLINSYPKILFLGFPRFDLYYKKQDVQTKNKKFTILYTPRWTSSLKKKNQVGSFLTYIDHFYNYAKNNHDIKIIIRPHPLMFTHYIENGIVESDYFEMLENDFKCIGNIFMDKNKDYSKSLEEADVFVSDYTSLLVEYFVSSKPVIYLGKLDLFNSDTKKMCKSFYMADSWMKIEKKLDQIRNGQDNLFYERKKLFPEIIKNYGKASENILNFLLKEYYKRGVVL